MTEPNKKLTDRQKQALPHLVGCGSCEEGCRAAGITRTTYYEWLKRPIFKKELDALREGVIRDAVDMLKGAATKAAQKLVGLLDTEDNPSLLRFVANDILGHVMKFKELEDIEARIQQLEMRVDNE